MTPYFSQPIPPGGFWPLHKWPDSNHKTQLDTPLYGVNSKQVFLKTGIGPISISGKRFLSHRL